MNEFDDTGQSKGSPKLGSNLARQLVPVEPTPAMLDAMQAAGIAAFDADVAASLGDTPLDPTHARRAVWRAALHAAPEAPSAEPYCYIYEYDVGSVVHREFHPHEYNGRKPSRTVPLYATPPEAPSAEPCPYVRNSGSTHWCALAEQSADHTAAMRMALDWLTDEQDGEDEDCGEQACGDCIVVRKRQVVIDALRAALGEGNE